MNKKAILIVTLILGLVVLVPLVAAAPLIQNSNVLQTQSQTQQGRGNCGVSCVQDGTAVECQQNQTCTQGRQCLNDGFCDNVCTGTGINGACNQTKTRERLCQQEGIQAGMMGGQQNCYGQQFLGKNCQAP